MYGQRGLCTEEKGKLREVETNCVALDSALPKGMQIKHSKVRESKPKTRAPHIETG